MIENEALLVVTEPAAEPISFTEAKEQLRLDVDDEKTLTERKLVEARAWAEIFCRRAFINQTLRLYLDRFPAWHPIRLPRAPVSAVSSVKYVDQNGVLQTLVADTDYQFDLVSEPSRILPAYGKHWPSTREVLNAVQVEFVAGYGASAAAIPAATRAIIQEGILARAADSFEIRTSYLIGTISSRLGTLAAESILQPLRMIEIS